MKQAVCFALAAAWLAALLAGCTKAPAESAVQAEPTPAATAAPTPTPEPSPTATPDPTATPEPAEYTPGVSTESGYTNTTLGFCFTPSENIVLATPEEIDAMIQRSADLLYGSQPNGQAQIDQIQQTSTYEMIAVDVVNGCSVTIANEVLPMAGITEEQYIQGMIQQMEGTALSLDITQDGSQTLALGDTEFTCLTYTASANGVEASQTMLLKKIADRMCLICLAYASPEEYAALLDCFTAITSV